MDEKFAAKIVKNVLQVQNFVVLAILTLGSILVTQLQEGQYDAAKQLLPFMAMFFGIFFLLKFVNWWSPIASTVVDIWIYSYRANKKVGKVVQEAIKKMEDNIEGEK